MVDALNEDEFEAEFEKFAEQHKKIARAAKKIKNMIQDQDNPYHLPLVGTDAEANSEPIEGEDGFDPSRWGEKALEVRKFLHDNFYLEASTMVFGGDEMSVFNQMLRAPVAISGPLRMSIAAIAFGAIALWETNKDQESKMGAFFEGLGDLNLDPTEDTK